MQTEDGLFVRYLPSELLRRLHVVDTPGTNVIVDRQQRLTEEFVPRSDLVLFIMSSDRPFTESEVCATSCLLACLRYLLADVQLYRKSASRVEG